MELALATHISVPEWERTDDASIATALTILAEQAAERS